MYGRHGPLRKNPAREYDASICVFGSKSTAIMCPRRIMAYKRNEQEREEQGGNISYTSGLYGADEQVEMRKRARCGWHEVVVVGKHA